MSLQSKAPTPFRIFFFFYATRLKRLFGWCVFTHSTNGPLTTRTCEFYFGDRNLGRCLYTWVRRHNDINLEHTALSLQVLGLSLYLDWITATRVQSTQKRHPVAWFKFILKLGVPLQCAQRWFKSAPTKLDNKAEWNFADFVVFWRVGTF